MALQHEIPSRNDTAQEHRWNLAPLFADDAAWEILFGKVEAGIPRYAEFKDRLALSAEAFFGVIALDLALSRDMEKLYTYAHLKSDEDKTNQAYLGLYGRAMNLYTRLSEAASFIVPEMHDIPADTMSAFLADGRAKGYEFYLHKILRTKPHTLSREVEEVLAMGGEIAAAPQQFFGQLDNADLKFGTVVDPAGAAVELSHGNFISFLMNPDAAVRKNAFFTYYEAYDAHRHSIATALAHSVKKDVFYARVRKYASCRAGSLFQDAVEESVYDNLVASVRANLAPLAEYLGFRKRALGLAELHFYDTYVPIVPDLPFSMSFEEAVETCVDALAPLGEEYTGVLRAGLLGGWVDRYENRGKRSGAYSSGCYDSPPYILMNYRDDTINSLYTLIHEAGHSMHSYFSRKAQPYHYGDYTIFVAEVASTFNEVLLSNHLMKKYADNPRMRAYILNREIDDIRGTLIRQTMFAEFEKTAHALAETHDPLTLETIRKIYRDLLDAYFCGAMTVDQVLELECLRIPHFYSPFYVYKYATGISAAIALAGAVAKGDSAARERYLRFLTLGGSMFPIDELREAGVDMASPVPVKAALAHFGSLVREFVSVHGTL
ncbi:MAG: oligoendopeptidase F [Spirochaetes bacterium]|nr:MAG: oligoendopeptidase F [Spirochaetota bacterium]